MQARTFLLGKKNHSFYRWFNAFLFCLRSFCLIANESFESGWPYLIHLICDPFYYYYIASILSCSQAVFESENWADLADINNLTELTERVVEKRLSREDTQGRKRVCLWKRKKYISEKHIEKKVFPLVEDLASLLYKNLYNIFYLFLIKKL